MPRAASKRISGMGSSSIARQRAPQLRQHQVRNAARWPPGARPASASDSRAVSVPCTSWAGSTSVARPTPARRTSPCASESSRASTSVNSGARVGSSAAELIQQIRGLGTGRGPLLPLQRQQRAVPLGPPVHGAHFTSEPGGMSPGSSSDRLLPARPRRQQHAARLDALELARLEVRHHHHAAAHQLLRRVRLRNARHDGARRRPHPRPP